MSATRSGLLQEAQLAEDAEKGGMTSEKQLKDAFASSYDALYAEQAAKWSGREMETDTANAIDYARTVGNKLVKGAGWTADEVDKGIQGISSALSKAWSKDRFQK
jgi:hypothetical protein